jgi:hypothetical protein
LDFSRCHEGVCGGLANRKQFSHFTNSQQQPSRMRGRVEIVLMWELLPHVLVTFNNDPKSNLGQKVGKRREVDRQRA